MNKVSINWVKIEKYSELTGESVEILRARCTTGEWRLGDEFKTVEGEFWINVKSAETWLEKYSDQPKQKRSRDDISASELIHVRFILVPLFCKFTGYSNDAVRSKMRSGVWLDGIHYRKAPDGRITMDLDAYYAWVLAPNGALK